MGEKMSKQGLGACEASTRQGPATSTLSYRFRREPQRLRNVVALQIRVKSQDLLGSHAIGHHIDDDRHRDPQSTNTGDTTHLIGSDGDARKGHEASLALEASLRKYKVGRG